MSGTLQEAQSFRYTRLSMKKYINKITLVSKKEEEVLKDVLLRQGKVAEHFVWQMD